ncbi:MAG: 3-oxoacyl-[acyl-carrier-protein] reductase, partial [Ignavibacteriales bacterium]|nr:3-oxoacyl-[acyl-carrier-protein] reductase [Ignavibacteriales bacterium]
MSELDNKVALVTGGSRGIGKAIALALAVSGAHVAFTYKSASSAAQETENNIRAAGRKTRSFQSDASSFNDALAVVESVVKEFGRLDILVNNAGITRDTLLLRMSEQDWDEVLDTNLKSAFNFSKAACKPMMSQREGVMINISSIAGVIGNPGQANYAAAKAGMIGMTKTLAKELVSRNIRVNAVAPGFIETDMTGKLTQQQKEALLGLVPMKRMGTPEDIARVVVFLSSPASAYMT